MNQQTHIDWTPVVVILTVLLLATAGILLHCNIHCVGSADPYIMRMQDKASTLKLLLDSTNADCNIYRWVAGGEVCCVKLLSPL